MEFYSSITRSDVLDSVGQAGASAVDSQSANLRVQSWQLLIGTGMYLNIPHAYKLTGHITAL